jgi:hypothetical protein
MADRTTLLSLGEEIFVLRWRWAPSEGALLSAFFEDGALRSLPFTCDGWIAAYPEDYWLFDSDMSGDQITDYLRVRMEMAKYCIETAYLTPGPDVCALVHRLHKDRSR